MMLSDRYSCQEHGKDVQEGCIACEVYSDIATLESSNQRLRKIADRLEVLAVKWVDAGHHDWPEIKNLSKALDELREKK
jgi:hypothetical protein